MRAGGQGLDCMCSKGCGHSGHRWGQVPVQTQSEVDAAKAPGVGQALRREAAVVAELDESLLVRFRA